MSFAVKSEMYVLTGLIAVPTFTSLNFLLNRKTNFRKFVLHAACYRSAYGFYKLKIAWIKSNRRTVSWLLIKQ